MANVTCQILNVARPMPKFEFFLPYRLNVTCCMLAGQILHAGKSHSACLHVKFCMLAFVHVRSQHLHLNLKYLNRIKIPIFIK